jgi:hypothetical protein
MKFIDRLFLSSSHALFLFLLASFSSSCSSSMSCSRSSSSSDEEVTGEGPGIFKTGAVPFPAFHPPPLPLSSLTPHLMKGHKDQVQRDPSLLRDHSSPLDSPSRRLAQA